MDEANGAGAPARLKGWLLLLAVFLFAVLIGTQNLRAAEAPSAASTLSEVQQAAWQCLREGGDLMGCYVRASPQRCKAAAVSMVGNPGLFRRTWGRCVVSCAKASWWDRHAGDCRK